MKFDVYLVIILLLIYGYKGVYALAAVSMAYNDAVPDEIKALGLSLTHNTYTRTHKHTLTT